MFTFRLMNTIQTKELVETSQSSIIEFETKYAAYKERVTRLNSTRPQSQELPHAFIPKCFKLETYKGRESKISGR